MSCSKMSWLLVAALAALGLVTSAAKAQPTAISEIYIDTPDGDRNEYFEVCGSGDMPEVDELEDPVTRYYFIQLENEDSNNEGEVDFFKELQGSFSGGLFWVANEDEALAGTPDQTWDPATEGHLENSGGTFLLVSMDVATGTVPVAGTTDWDPDDDGELEIPTGYTIIDSVGIACEEDDICSGVTLYGATDNFFVGRPWEMDKCRTNESDDCPIPTNYETDDCFGPLDEGEFLARCDDCSGAWYAAEINETGSDGSITLEIDETSGGRAKAISADTVPWAGGETCSSPGADNANCAGGENACDLCN